MSFPQFQEIHDTSEYFSCSGRTTHSFHIFSTLISCPYTYEIVVSESESPVITEISRCPRLHEDISIFEIECRVYREATEFRISIGEYGDDHISIFRIYTRLTLEMCILSFEKSKRTIRSTIRKNRIRFEELIEGYFTDSECESETVVIG